MMAIGALMEFSAGTTAQYDAVIEDMQLGGKAPPRCIFHIAGPTEGGGFRVVDVWESQEAFNDFAQNKIGPITQKHGLSEPNVTTWPVHNTLS